MAKMKKLFDEPASQERDYVRILLAYARGLATDANSVLVKHLGAISRAYRQDDWADDLALLFIELERLAGGRTAAVVERLPGQYTATATFNDRQFRLVTKAKTGVKLPPAQGPLFGITQSPLGIDVYRTEPWLEPLRKAWVDQNTVLIKSIPTRLHPELRGIVDRGVTNGLSVAEMTKQIKERYAVTESRAKLIAQDQILKSNAALTQQRLKSVGVESYIWRTVGDSRVRPRHAEREGQEYRWDNPPDGGHPGTEVRCRCRAEAVWTDEP